jgi:UPF0755 protein
MRSTVGTVFKIALVLVILGGLGIGGYTAYTRMPKFLNELIAFKPKEPLPGGQEVVVTIPKGATLSQVGGILEENSVISSRLVFKLVAFIRGEQRNIKAGDYALKTGSDAGDILDLLISGKTIVFSFTVPEGYDLFQVAELFQQNGIMTKEEFLTLCKDKALLKEFGIQGASLEGFLFPDTYTFRPSEKGQGAVIVRKMVQRYQEVFDKHVRATAEEFGWTPEQVVTLASLIEKEARASEHATVSAVFHNRLRLKMRLQSDPTVIYGIKAMGAKITHADLNRKHPYNTYQNAGLPPGPICNPGKESLVGAVKPADVDYLYFVAKNDGTHQFSKSLEEHNRWVDLYQRSARNKTERP